MTPVERRIRLHMPGTAGNVWVCNPFVILNSIHYPHIKPSLSFLSLLPHHLLLLFLFSLYPVILILITNCGFSFSFLSLFRILDFPWCSCPKCQLNFFRFSRIPLWDFSSCTQPAHGAVFFDSATTFIPEKIPLRDHRHAESRAPSNSRRHFQDPDESPNP